MNIFKYFWDLNEKALKETKKILKNPAHPKFFIRIISLLSRCNKPKELFSIISKKEFMKNWPKIRSYWIKITRRSDFRDWWETIYEQLLEQHTSRQKKPTGKSLSLFLEVGKLIRDARIKKGLSQAQTALYVGMNQPDISNIEEGKQNITLVTLLRIAKAVGIKRIKIDVTKIK